MLVKKFLFIPFFFFDFYLVFDILENANANQCASQTRFELGPKWALDSGDEDRFLIDDDERTAGFWGEGMSRSFFCGKGRGVNDELVEEESGETNRDENRVKWTANDDGNEAGKDDKTVERFYLVFISRGF